MKIKDYKAILFDSGRVLNESSSGHWFIGPRFFEIINQTLYEAIELSKRQHAFSVAGAYIHRVSLIQTKEEELAHFKHYYTLFSQSLPQLHLSESDIEDLAQDLVFNASKYTFYEDAIDAIPRLSQTHQLAIVSDAWPSLTDVYVHANLKQYFSSFIISSVLGVSKPDKRMYETALTELNITSSEAIFVDDNLNNCLGAKKIGIHPVYLCRYKPLYYLQKICSLGRGYTVIYSLNQLK